jgi:oligopeptide transport system permease protein
MFFHKKKNAVEKAGPATQVIINPEAKDFEFVQMDKSIHDLKFQTKPTTFLKDAMHRFVKNRSSVVAAFLLGILVMMAIIVPIADGSDIDTAADYAGSLPPRWSLFQGTGFLDGTNYYSSVTGYVPSAVSTTNTTGAVTKDTSLEDVYPYNYDANAIVSGTLTRSFSTTNAASDYGFGGTLVLTASSHIKNAILYSPTAYVRTSKDYELSVTPDSAYCTSASMAPYYRIYAEVYYDATSTTVTEVPLRDWSYDYSAFAITDLSTIIQDNNPSTSITTNFKAYFCVELATNTTYEPEDVGDYPSFYLDSFEVTCTSVEDTYWNSISWTDANSLKLRDTATDTTYVWKIAGAGNKSLRDVNIVKCSFRYDEYEAAFGIKSKDIDETTARSYISKGWMSYDFDAVNAGTATAAESLVRLDDKCPIMSVASQSVTAVETTNTDGTTTIVYKYTLVCQVSYYRYYGFTSIPSYIFGTNAKGYDYFKYLFTGLRTSLILGVLCALINVSFGLLWGSISGYFGGWVDIIMERFTEILGGIPWIVVMTLCILNLGQNFWVFLLALCLTGWMSVSSMTRSQFYRYKGREYVLASRTLGANDSRLIFRHILPNAIGPIVTSSILIIPGVIFSEATISYLGLGLKGMKSFGVALSEAQGVITTSPYLIICGSIIVSILMISFNLFGNGLRDAFNPSLKGVDE